ncbi:hypothetical protein [Bacillus marinisedimentorum]|uniref:hypothetical protein n=1 Tax=Bacillus marinisedimentorum TaxID=1821260 RepID=UPI000872D76A|nr:hypothetical protein [Bacillus marinisedimentorum]
MDTLRLNVNLLRERVPNLTTAARAVGLRPATVSNLTTGKTPIGRAEVRTLAALASLAECSLDELIIRGESFTMLETGIKVVDLFSPIVEGGTAGLVARPGMGQIVVLAEILHVMRKEGYTTLLLRPEGKYPDLDDIAGEVDVSCEKIDEVFEAVKKAGDSKGVIFAADRSHVITNETFLLQERLGEADINYVTTFLLDLKGEAVDEELPYGPLETLLQFDADLASRQIFPALNPLLSTSVLLEGGETDKQHFLLQQRARKVLRRYRELRFFTTSRGVDTIPTAEAETYKRGERLEAYLSQPFYTAAEFTGQPGISVPLKAVLNDVNRILDGTADDRSPEEMKYIGSF